MDQKNRVGIMGGTFNPIHFGHLMTGECAYEQFGLDKVLFMPSKTPPHKTIQEHISADDRASMVKLAIEGNPHFAFSGMELERSGVTYTVDTLRELHQMHPDCQYYFIIGADSLFDFAKWREPKEILKLATVLVASRYGIAKEKLKEQADKLERMYGGNIQIVDMPTIDFSSSEIRTRRKEGKDVRYYVDEKVRIYIEEHELYRG